MRPLMEFFADLRARGVTVALDGESLRCSAPPGVLDAALKAELVAQKAAIIAFLRQARAGRGQEPELIRVERTDTLPLSFAQQRLWFLHQLDPESTVYNIGLALELVGPLNVPAFQAALCGVVARHENLRTSFTQVNGVPQTRIDAEVMWSPSVDDMRHLAGPEARLELLCHAQSLIREPIDLSRAPLLHAHLLMLAPDRHMLVLSVHHIVFDGWSIGVFGRELAELYRAHAAGKPPTLAPLALQYVDFAVWQRRWLEAGELERQLGYWRKQLAGAPPVITFPPDHRRPGAELFRGARAKMVVPADLTAALESLAQRKGATLFMVLLAGFKILLARYSGQEDIVVGSPSASRTRTELYPMTGFFVNNLVLRTDLGDNPAFAELLERVRGVTLRAYEHQDVPFDELVQALRPDRSLDHSPLFQIMFILQNFPVEELQLAEVKIERVELEVDTARYDLTVEAFPHKGAIDVYFDYNTDLYDAVTISRLQQHFLAILTAVAGNAEVRIMQILLLSPTEREILLDTWNRTEKEIAADICFHHQFERIAWAAPNRVAVRAGDASMTYGELDRRANRIARALRARGAGPGTHVALFLERGLDLVAAMLGAAKAGAAYVPLDPMYPRGRLQQILEDAEPVAILSSSRLRERLPACGREPLCVDAADALPEEDTAPAGVTVTQKDLAYVIFTSGSTGRPKGVEIPHRALLNFLEFMQAEPGFSAADTLLAVTTVSFDIAGLELLLPLYSGGTVCVALEPGNPEALLRDLERYRPSVMQATPATWKLLLAAGWQGDARMKLLCGGEAMEPALARSLLVRCESLWNMYGPTETTIWSAAYRVDTAPSDAVPVGRPIGNTSFYILDNAGQPVPQGVAGELWIGGEGLARGYLNRPDLTAERFVSCPFVETPGARMYRTGDLVRYRPDGTLDFYGRLDHQVKLRGFRIELGEIENALRNCDGIVDAVVLVREDAGERRLVAYLVHAGEPPLHSQIRDRLREELPEYMVPSAFVFLQSFPRLPNGKLDRSSLPVPEPPSTGIPAVPELPATGLQQAVAQVFRDVLSIDRVGLEDNFFDLGAHSLQMVRAHAELNRRLPLPVSLIHLFQYPNVRALSAFMEQGSAAGTIGAAQAGESHG